MFGDKLKALRLELGLKQAEMAHRLHVDTSTYCRWEHKQHPPTYAIDRISKTFGVDAWSWMREDEPPATEPEPGPKLVYMNAEMAKQEPEGHGAGMRLLDRMMDLAEWLMRRSNGRKVVDNEAIEINLAGSGGSHWWVQKEARAMQW